MKKNRFIGLPLVILFIVLNALFITSKKFLLKYNIDQEVILIANLLMFILSMLAIIMHRKSIKNPNPNVFARSIMGATVLKLFVLASAAIIYFIAAAGSARNVNAVFGGMVLYVLYSILEVRIALLLNKHRDEVN